MRINKKTFYFLILFLMLEIFAFSSDDAKQSEQSKKIATALSSETAMRDAMEIVFIDIGYYVSLEDLNDLLNGSPIKYYDDINQFLGTPVIDTATGLYKPTLEDLTKSPKLWLGPYITYQPSTISEDGAGYDIGTPLDPWQRPYYFFSPLGLIKPPSRSVSLDFYGDAFDRYAIVCLGPDGIKSNDDIITLFGGAPTKTVISSVSPSQAQRGDEVTVNGYNFGLAKKTNLKTDKSLYVNGVAANQITLWSDRVIKFIINDNMQSGDVKIIINGEESNTFHLDISAGPSRINVPWELYQ